MTDVACSRILRLAALLLVFAVPATTAFAQDQPVYRDRQVYSKLGGYIAIGGLPRFTLDAKTFDGESVYIEEGGEEFSVLPKLDSRNLLKIVAGFRNRPFALEISYEYAKHEGVFQGFLFDSTFRSVNVDGKVFFRTHSKIQPHILVGLGFPWLNVKDGSFSSDRPDAEVGNSRWRGPALNTEGGVSVYLTPRAGVSAGYAYRFIWFNRERGVSDQVFELHPPFGESAGNIVILGFFTF